MTERKGSLMPWRAECGHSMVVYSLEPTPASCPDCAERVRQTITRDFDQSAPWIDIDGPTDLDSWLAEADLGDLPNGLVEALGKACESFAEAQRLADDINVACSDAWSVVRRALDEHAPAVERLTMPEAS